MLALGILFASFATQYHQVAFSYGEYCWSMGVFSVVNDVLVGTTLASSVTLYSVYSEAICILTLMMTMPLTNQPLMCCTK